MEKSIKKFKKKLEIRKKVVPLQKKQQNQSNMTNEILCSEGAHTTNFRVIWTTGECPHWRTYSREFQSLKDMAKFICKHPERNYTSIRQDEDWIEERENFMGFAGLHSVHCSKVVKNFLQMDIAWGSIANDEYCASFEELKKV